MIEALQTAAVLVAFFVVPGITWGPLIAPGTPPGLSRIGRTLGSSLLVTAIAMTALAILGLLRPAVVVAMLVILSLAPLTIPSVRRSVARLRLPARRRVGWALAIAGLGFAATFIVLPSHAKLDEAPLPASTTVWYYAHLAESVAATGGFPADFPEWGGSRPFQTDYAPFTAHSAAVFDLLPTDLPAALETYRLAILAAGFCLGVLALPPLVFHLARRARDGPAARDGPTRPAPPDLSAGSVRFRPCTARRCGSSIGPRSSGRRG